CKVGHVTIDNFPKVGAQITIRLYSTKRLSKWDSAIRSSIHFACQGGHRRFVRCLASFRRVMHPPALCESPKASKFAKMMSWAMSSVDLRNVATRKLLILWRSPEGWHLPPSVFENPALSFFDFSQNQTQTSHFTFKITFGFL